MIYIWNFDIEPILLTEGLLTFQNFCLYVKLISEKCPVVD